MVSLRRGRPCRPPACRSARSIARHPCTSIAPGCRSRTRALRSRREPTGPTSSPALKSSTSCSTVSCAHVLLVPMNPVGPRLIHPTTYAPRRPSTRPRTFGTIPACSSKGRSGSATPAIADRSEHEPGLEDLGVLGRYGPPRRRPARPAWLRTTRTPVTASVAEDLARARLAKRSTMRRLPGRVGGAARPQGGQLPARHGVVAPISVGRPPRRRRRCPSRPSRPISSGNVNAAWAGPRRPSTTTSRTRAPPAAPRARGRRCRCAPVASGSVVRIRATSRATLPLPTTTARSCAQVDVEIRLIGVAVVPGHEVGGGAASGQVLPRYAEASVLRRAGGVHDGVVVLGQLGVR